MFPLYKIETIKLISFELVEIRPESLIKVEDILIDVSTGMQWLKEKKNIGILVTVKYRNSTNNEILLTAISENNFLIKNYDEVIEHREDGSIMTPDPLLQAMFSVSIGTIRGMIVLKTENTYLANVLLPPVNPKIMIDAMKKNFENAPEVTTG
jgi:hypothetical protein